MLALGVEQSIGTLRDFPSWPGRIKRPPNGPKIRLQSTSALLALSPSCPTGGGVQIRVLGAAVSFLVFPPIAAQDDCDRADRICGGPQPIAEAPGRDGYEYGNLRPGQDLDLFRGFHRGGSSAAVSDDCDFVAAHGNLRHMHSLSVSIFGHEHVVDAYASRTASPPTAG